MSCLTIAITGRLGRKTNQLPTLRQDKAHLITMHINILSLDSAKSKLFQKLSKSCQWFVSSFLYVCLQMFLASRYSLLQESK